MSDSPATVLTCTQCGGELHPDEGQIFLTCPYCGTTVYIDKAQVVFHWSLTPTLTQEQAQAALYRWMSGSSTVKDLDKKAEVISHGFSYFPLWYFRLAEGGRERAAVEPAAATSITELRSLALPAGDLQRYRPELDAQSEKPTVPLAAARAWLDQDHAGAEVRESSLVHIPIYIFKYNYFDQTYTAVVEAATGSVQANIFPAKAEGPYLLAGGVTALVFLCLALIPVVGAMMEDDGGALAGFGIAALLALIAAPFLFALAVWVASKV
jgi:hypothetical protein